jgi:very-short-patch-repair endonuclease
MGPRDAVDLLRTLAEQQHGVVARRQLLAAGIGRERIASWRRCGRLIVQRRGVYSLGHALLTQEARWMAAVLVCGDGAVLSHRSAAALWGLRPPGGGAIEVTVGIDGPRLGHGDGIRPRRSGLVQAFATVERGIPVTTVAWTLLDLAAVVRSHQLRRAVEEADRLELFDLAAVERALEAGVGRRGTRAMMALLGDMAERGVTRTRSDVEAAFLQLCIDHGLPRPEVNRVRDGVEQDFRWPRHRLIVEVDGWAYHRGRAAFAADRARDRRALTASWRVARFPATEVFRAPAVVAHEVARLLRHM